MGDGNTREEALRCRECGKKLAILHVSYDRVYRGHEGLCYVCAGYTFDNLKRIEEIRTPRPFLHITHLRRRREGDRS